jgi:hypothetical protein
VNLIRDGNRWLWLCGRFAIPPESYTGLSVGLASVAWVSIVRMDAAELAVAHDAHHLENLKKVVP